MSVCYSKILAAAAATMALALAGPASAQGEVTLKLHHLLGPEGARRTSSMLEPWAKRIDEAIGRPGQDRDLSVDVARRHAAAAHPARCATASSTSSGP